ncbi:MAG: FHA domain-containing protein [Planctomycetota bacterium]
MPKLIITGPDKIPREHIVIREMTLGRNPENDLQLPEEKASRRHCRFRPEGGKVTVEDLGSSNGTKVNGVKVQTCVLKDGDAIAIGAHTIVFRDVDAELVLAPGTAGGDKEPPAGHELAGSRPVGTILDIATAVQAEEKSGEGGPTRQPVSAKKVSNGLPAGAVRAPETARRPRSSMASLLGVTVAAAVLVGIALVLYQRRDTLFAALPAPPKPADPTVPPPPLPPKRSASQARPDENKAAVRLPPKPPEDNEAKNQATVSPVAPVPPVAKTQAEADADIAAAWTKALAERDRGIASGNFPGARGAISSFLAAHPGGEPGKRAQQELADTQKLIEAALDLQLKDAQKAAADKSYRLAVQRCTRLVGSDPAGKFGAAAHELMTRIDESTEARFAEVNANATAQIHAGQLHQAGEILEQALDELGGTKWAEQISAKQLQVLMARAFMRRLEGERVKASESGKTLAVSLPGRKIAGVLGDVSGLALEVRAGARRYPVPLKDLTPEEMQSVLKPLNLAENHVELAYLWLLLEKTAAAQAEVEQALQNPQQEAAAIRLVSLLPNQKNLHIYDFSKWQHQSDWDALTGSWCTQNGKYVLDSSDGGDTCLRPAAIGGPFPAKNAHISFDFELSKPGPGYFFAFELGSEENGAVSAIFSEKGLALHANLAGAIHEQDEWTPGPTHVDFSAKGDTVTVTANGKKAKPLDVPGLSALKGAITFRVRESGCAIGNVILRNVE